MSASALYRGQVMHRRLRPARHALRYRVFWLLLDLDELPALARRLRLFSCARFNLFAFHPRDHGDGSATPLRAQVETLLAQAGIAGGGAVRLLTMPRLLGFAFNPISVYYCHDAAGTLSAILYEVNNTFGERHAYLLPVRGGPGIVHQRAAKAFHVSPFLPLRLDYRFRVMPPGERLVLGISAEDEAGPVLTAALAARRHDLSDAALVRAFLAMPLLTAKVVLAIGWEALLLWLKRVPVIAHPRNHPPAISFATPGAE